MNFFKEPRSGMAAGTSALALAGCGSGGVAYSMNSASTGNTANGTSYAPASLVSDGSTMNLFSPIQATATWPTEFVVIRR